MERDHVIDIAKGLGEILVCIGHSKFNTKFEVKINLSISYAFIFYIIWYDD